MKKQGKFYDTILSKIKTVDYMTSQAHSKHGLTVSHIAEDISQHVARRLS